VSSKAKQQTRRIEVFDSFTFKEVISHENLNTKTRDIKCRKMFE
jgi:hypothetical protein